MAVDSTSRAVEANRRSSDGSTVEKEDDPNVTANRKSSVDETHVVGQSARDILVPVGAPTVTESTL